MLNLLSTGSTAAHSTQTNNARPTTVCEGLEKSTRYRLREDKDSDSNITIAIIVLSCLFVIISLIYFAVCYQSKRQQPESAMLWKVLTLVTYMLLYVSIVLVLDGLRFVKLPIKMMLAADAPLLLIPKLSKR